MAQNNDLAQKIKEYLELDRQIESFNQKTGELRKKRTVLEESLIKTICSKNMDNKMLTLNKEACLNKETYLNKEAYFNKDTYLNKTNIF